MTVRWGVVGPGRIASKVVGDAPLVPNAEFVAVASRSAERAQAFAAAHDIPRAHDSYQAILDDDGIDVLYIATTHPQHRAIALAALRAGKAILVEKAFTVTPEATREIVELATATGTFAMEAMWTRFQPAVVRLRELVADGALGEIRSVQGELCVQANLDPSDRFLNPAIGGGAVFDLSVYPISFAQMLLGDPGHRPRARARSPTPASTLRSRCSWASRAARSAALFCSLRCASPGQLRVFGTEGWIDVLPRFHHPDTIVLHRGDRAGDDRSAAHRRRVRARADRGDGVRRGGQGAERRDAVGRHRRRAGRHGRGGAPARGADRGGPSAAVTVGDGVLGRLVLPDPHHPPARVGEPTVGGAVARDVGVELGPPPRPVVPRRGGVLRAAVPEAAVDEDHHAGAGEDEVAAGAQLRQRAVVHPVAVAQGVQPLAHSQFGPGVPGRCRDIARRLASSTTAVIAAG